MYIWIQQSSKYIGLNSPTDITQFNYDDHWQEIEIDLERVNNQKQNFSFFYNIIF